MKAAPKQITKILGIFISVALLAVLFQWRASQNLSTQNYYRSNFFVFWLSGKLLLERQNPYNPNDWAEGHTLYGNITPREPTFLYPLPLAVFLTPLGVSSVAQAYFLWQWISQLAVALVVYFLLKRWDTTAHQRLFVPVMLFITFFGPNYLTLQIGALGAITLLMIFSALHFLDKDRLFPAGILLALTMLKPSQGATILLLLGFVFLLRKQWTAIWGILTGGLLLLLIGLIVDANWLSVFLHSSEAAFDRRLGVQSNIWSFSYVACKGISPCYSILGAIGMLVILGVCAFHLWRNHQNMTNWQILNLILPVAFLSTLYLWAYDQILYILPIIWIVGTMTAKSKGYFHAILFLVVLDFVSFFALMQQAVTEKDLWSLSTTVLVLAFLVIAGRMKQKPAIDKAPASA
ncbi:hypothetical protein MASR2M66_06090 [Chloroflexota bacterium]